MVWWVEGRTRSGLDTEKDLGCTRKAKLFLNPGLGKEWVRVTAGNLQGGRFCCKTGLRNSGTGGDSKARDGATYRECEKTNKKEESKTFVEERHCGTRVKWSRVGEDSKRWENWGAEEHGRPRERFLMGGKNSGWRTWQKKPLPKDSRIQHPERKGKWCEKRV